MRESMPFQPPPGPTVTEAMASHEHITRFHQDGSAPRCRSPYDQSKPSP